MLLLFLSAEELDLLNTGFDKTPVISVTHVLNNQEVISAFA